MSTWDGGFSPAPNFHPEFGYLCPSARLRRKVRGAVVTLAAGTLIAGSVGLALLAQLSPRPPDDGGRQETALSAMPLPPPIEKAADLKTPDIKATGQADEGIPAIAMARAVASERAAAARAQASCDDLSGSFLAPQCQLGRTGKSHASRTARAAHEAGNRAATVSIGRADAALQTGPQEAGPRQSASQESAPRRVAASRLAPAVETAATAAATNEAPAAAMPAPKPAAPANKPVKSERKSPTQQAPGREVASADTPAAPSLAFDLFGLFHRTPRTGNGIWAVQ
jgi:hypothetical protein